LDIQQTTILICQDFELGTPFGGQNYSKEQIRNWLANAIARMMHEDMERLLWILYRLDIDEKKAVIAMSLSEAPDLALADLVIERELQKVHSRRAYKQWQENQPNRSDNEIIEPW